MQLETLPPVVIRLASRADALSITVLYQQVYQGNYPNPLMRDTAQLATYLATSNSVWVIATAGERVIGSVIYEVDDAHAVGRVHGGAVLPEFRGTAVLERMMTFGYDHLTTGSTTEHVEVVYATTRTSSPAPQIITTRLGYNQLGLFPNVHRTDVYETHGLTALFTPAAWRRRFVDFRLHPSIARLYDLVQAECGLAPLAPANADDLALDDYDEKADLEVIAAERFVLRRFEALQSQGKLQSHFYPFHSPNILMTSSDQEVEVFGYLAPSDKYCTLIGIKKPRSYDFTAVLDSCSRLLHGLGARYIEVLVRADKSKTMERVLQARFIPCAYFPAFQRIGEARYDFVVCSRTFEVIDFRNLRLAGKNMVFLEEYLRNLQEYYLKPVMPEGKP